MPRIKIPYLLVDWLHVLLVPQSNLIQYNISINNLKKKDTPQTQSRKIKRSKSQTQKKGLSRKQKIQVRNPKLNTQILKSKEAPKLTTYQH